jgi:hypothetical protein
MKKLKLRDITLMASVACGLIQNGAQLFAVSIIARTVSKAPPRSFAIFTGEYPYDSRAFWDTVPMITFALFVIALIANWKTARRKYLLLTLALFIAGGLIAGLYLEPTFDDMIARGYADYIDPAMQHEAATWYMVDCASWALGFIASLSLLVALVLPADTTTPNQRDTEVTSA